MNNNLKYKRIIVLGGTSSGKSTLAKRLGDYTGYPVFHLDILFRNEKNEQIDKAEWKKIQSPLLLNQNGIIEGSYSSALPERIEWSDLIIFIDISTRTRFLRLLQRCLKDWFGIDKRIGYRGQNKSGLSLKFLKWALFWNKNSRPKTIALLEKVNNKKILIIKNPKKIDIEGLLKM